MPLTSGYMSKRKKNIKTLPKKFGLHFYPESALYLVVVGKLA
jgi:hypothetical protein